MSPNNYADEKSWLCRPGQNDACAVDLTTTVVAADGSLKKETWTADAKAPIDCFYVYPTVSTDTTPNSDMTADPAELNVVAQQFARLGSKCRPYAPIYRQITLAGLRRVLASGGGTNRLGGGVQYDDVRDAWRHYIQHDNQGRGVVLVGHSQGRSSYGADSQRNRRQADPDADGVGDPDGDGVPVPQGQGRRRRVPEHPALQVGVADRMRDYLCVVPIDHPATGQHAVRKGGRPEHGRRLHEPGGARRRQRRAARLSDEGRTTPLRAAPVKPWVVPEKPIETPWVSVPGLLTREVQDQRTRPYLESRPRQPVDPRVDDITGDLGAGPQVLANWGLHLVDVNLGDGQPGRHRRPAGEGVRSQGP